jgi:hypothetical protein
MTNISILKKQRERLEAELKLHHDAGQCYHRQIEIGTLLYLINAEIQEAELEEKKRQLPLLD